LKIYRSPRELLAEVEKTLATNKPSFQHSPLNDVIETLCLGRHYGWMGIYLAVDQQTQQLLGSGGESGLATALPETRSKILVSMKLAGREVGVLAVESDREPAFGSDDRVLLEKVATTLARFLAGPGKYLVRKARETAAAAQSAPTRKPQSVTENPRASSAAVGEQ
jgi:GAF domain-containing protein